MANKSVASRFDPFGFFSWWFGELAGLLPGFVRRGFRRGTRVLVLERHGAELAARQRVGGRERELGHIDLQLATDRERQRFGRRLARGQRRDAEVVLRLPPEDVLARRLDLPLVADSDLRQALYFEIDRQTPFRPEETYFDYTVISRHNEDRRLSVDLTIVPRKIVANAEAGLAEWGIAADTVEVEGSPGTSPVHIALHDASGERRGLGVGGLVNLLLLLLIVGGLAAAIYIPLEARQRVSERLADDLRQAKARAESALSLRKELDALIETNRGLQKRKLEAPSSVLILDEVTRRLPDDVWLTNMQLEGGEVRLTGYAPTAATLIGLLDASDRFQTPRFRSPVTQDARLDKERFTLTFELERKEASAK